MPDPATTPRVLLDVPITFRVGDERTHAPMVELTIHGTPTKLIFDTGSTDHILTTELADQLGLEASPGEEGTDSTGASVPSWTLGEVPISIEGSEFLLSKVIAIAGPAPFAAWGIGGFVSPQHLHPTAWTVLDLEGERLFLLDGSQADVTAWLTTRSPSLQPLTLERVAGDGTVLVRAAVHPFEPVVTLLDSGGKGTEALATSVPGLTGGERSSTGKGVGGGESFGSVVAGQALIVDGTRVSVPALILREAMGDYDILVGMNTLRGTILAVSADPDRPVIWLVRPAA